jgi:alpha-galactosidase/6-phospho-beta-glucosidase family protein
MPDFTPDDIDISPEEFLNSCSTRERNELIEELVEQGYIDRSALSSEQLDETINKRDCDFVDALNSLRNKRHLLTTTEEGFIISLADKFKHY